MRSFKSFAIAISLFVPNFLTSEAIDTSGLQRAIEIHSALTARPDRRVDRYWKGTETICVIARKDHAVQVLDFVAALNLGYLTDFDAVNVVNYLACPSSTSLFVLAEETATPDRISDVIEAIEGFRPPYNFFEHDVWGGFSMRLYNQNSVEFVTGHLPKELVFFNVLSPPVHSNPDPSVSIMLEEMMHSLTGLGDLPSNQIRSLLGENANVVDYDHWFTKNPTGLCDADLYLLEMAIGPNVRAIASRTTSLKWFAENQDAVDTSVENAKAHLSLFLDPRCK